MIAQHLHVYCPRVVCAAVVTTVVYCLSAMQRHHILRQGNEPQILRQLTGNLYAN